MKIAIYTLTRDRLQYTKDCFASLWENAGMPFDHYVWDNGSTDGTQEWICEGPALRETMDRIELASGRKVTDLKFGALSGFRYAHVHLHNENVGISRASNILLSEIVERDYDLIIKADNDAFVRTPNILPQICDMVREAGENWILSPRVEGINKQPRRTRNVEIAGHPVGVTAIVGGLFHVVPAAVYRRYMEQGGYPESLPKAWGQDDRFCHWFKTTQRGNCGYIEDLVVEHYRSTTQQAIDYPEYFTRKWQEEL